MPPKSKLKRKAEQASQLSVEARKMQRLSSESVESIAAAVETTPSSSARVEETVSSWVAPQVSSAIEAPCVSRSISAQTITSLPSTACPSFVRETEGIGEATEVEESVGGEGAFGDGEDKDSDMSVEDTATTSKPSQEIFGKFVDKWLQVLDKEEAESVAMFLCYHLVGMFSFTETKAAECAVKCWIRVNELCDDGEMQLSGTMELCWNQNMDDTSVVVWCGGIMK